MYQHTNSHWLQTKTEWHQVKLLVPTSAWQVPTSVWWQSWIGSTWSSSSFGKYALAAVRLASFKWHAFISAKMCLPQSCDEWSDLPRVANFADGALAKLFSHWMLVHGVRKHASNVPDSFAPGSKSFESCAWLNSGWQKLCDLQHVGKLKYHDAKDSFSVMSMRWSHSFPRQRGGKLYGNTNRLQSCPTAATESQKA